MIKTIELKTEWTGDIAPLLEITDLTETNGNWIVGTFKGQPHLCFEAKVFATPSSFGINSGRVSKFCITQKDQHGTKTRYSYDRGENLAPQTVVVKKFLARFLELLDGASVL